MHTLRSARSSPARLLAAGALACLLASCGTVSKVDPAEQQIRVENAIPVAFDIENFNGSVTIIVDPARSDVKPVIKKHVSWWTEHSVREDAQAAIDVRSRTTQQDGFSVVAIKTTSNYVEPERVWVDMTIYTPRCDGVRVWNRGGKVTLIGVAGAIQVENGAVGDNEGAIEVRTDKNITDPVVLSTEAGLVVYQVGPGSSGKFTLDSADSAEEFECRVASLGQVHSDGGSTTATLNAGENPVLITSKKGKVVVMVMNDPMSYSNVFR